MYLVAFAVKEPTLKTAFYNDVIEYKPSTKAEVEALEAKLLNELAGNMAFRYNCTLISVSKL